MNAQQIKADQDALFRKCEEQKARREAGLLEAPRPCKRRSERVAAIRARRLQA